MSKHNDDLLIDRYVRAMGAIIKRVKTGGGKDKWPLPKLHIWDCEIYCVPFLLKKLYNYFKKAEKTIISEAEIAAAYKYPTHFSRITFFYLFRPLSGLSQEQIKWLGYKITRILNLLVKGNFAPGLLRKNILWDALTLKKYLENIKFINITKGKRGKDYCKLLGQITGKLFLYNEIIYNDFQNIGFEIHGPYKTCEGQLLVREYQNFNFDFWPDSRRFPCKKIIIYELFKDKIRIGMDINNKLYADRPFAENLKKFAIIVDNKIITGAESMEKLSALLDRFLEKFAVRKSRQSKKSIIKSFAFVKFMVVKPLADLLGEDWRPPKKILKKINELKLTKREKQFNNYLFANKIGFKQRFDPRVKI